MQTSGTDVKIQALNNDLFNLHQKGFEEFEKISQANAQCIELAIATKLHEYGAEMRYALSQHARQIIGLTTESAGQIEVLVNSTRFWQLHTHLLQDEKIKSILMGLIIQPDLMRSVCDTVFHSRNLVGSSDASLVTRVTDQDRKIRRKRCTCAANYRYETSKSFQVKRFRIFGLRLGLQSFAHSNSCSLSKPHPKSTVITVALHNCGALLARAIRASITINRGAGGLSISHKLDIARAVPRDSRAFQIVDWHFAVQTGVIKNIIDFDRFLRDSVREIENLFRNGSASPWDIDEDGDTLLEVRICA